MITCRTAGFSFLHIPKTGGSTIREQLRHLDDHGEMFIGKKEHPVIGTYRGSHVPMKWMQEFWPEHLAEIRDLDVFAVTRNPKDRFVSAVAQRMRQYLRTAPSQMSRKEISKELDVIVDHLSDGRDFPAIQFEHFLRQTDFTELDGEKIATHIYRIEDLAHLIDEFSRRLDMELVRNLRVNQTVDPKSKTVLKVLRTLKGVAQPLLPKTAYNRLHAIGTKAFTKDGSAKLKDFISESKQLDAFVKSHYEADFNLFESTPRREGHESQRKEHAH